MIPATFDYVAPSTLDEAVSALSEAGEDAKVLAGGQSLVPVLRFRLAVPTGLVDLGRVEELRGVRNDGDALVIGAMWAIVASDGFWWLPVALITLREAAISAFRSYWGRRGLAVPATFLAKVKTVVQSLAVALALVPALEDHAWLPAAALWVAVVLTLVSGAQYLVAGSRVTTAAGVRR